MREAGGSQPFRSVCIRSPVAADSRRSRWPFGGNFSTIPTFKSIDMKAKLMIVLCSAASLLVVILALWGTWSHVYHRGFDHGYSQGGRDEFLRWKQEPTRLDRSWDGVITGRRNTREKVRLSVGESRPWPVNAWSAPFNATGTVSVPATRAPEK